MNFYELIHELNKVYPESIQEEWDNSGIQIGDLEQNIHHILLVLDITEESLNYAIDNNIDLIISHHPLLFSPIQSLIKGRGKSDLIIKAIKNGINIYSMHTNLDKDKKGVSANLLKTMDFHQDGFLDETGFVPFSETHIKKEECIQRIKDTLKIEDFIFYGKADHFSKIAVCGGSGGSFIDLCIEENIDLFITGDLKHHDVELALLHGLSLMDIGHFNSEIEILKVVRKTLEVINDKIKIETFTKNPYKGCFIKS